MFQVGIGDVAAFLKATAATIRTCVFEQGVQSDVVKVITGHPVMGLDLRLSQQGLPLEAWMADVKVGARLCDRMQ